jgi:4-hydroxy-tetrahydrodipicolinate synthase
MKPLKLSGLIPATLTPFTDDNSIDADELVRHVGRVAGHAGVTGVAVNGHAGEISMLDLDERTEVVKVAKSALGDKLLFAGIEALTADHLERQAAEVASVGADGFLVMPPFDQRSLRHLASDVDSVVKVFSQLDRNVGKPIIVFAYPESSGCSYPLEVLEALAEIPSVVAIKTATGHITPYVDIYDALHEKVSVLAANDGPPLLSMLLHGAAAGLIGISVVGTPIWVDLVREATQGSADAAVKIFRERCLPLTASIFENQTQRTHTSAFGATKEALYQLGELKSPRLRAPGVAPTPEVKERIRRGLIQAGLLNVSA